MINDTMSDDEVVTSDVPRGTCFCSIEREIKMNPYFIDSETHGK